MPARLKKLAFVKEMRRFGERELDLEFDGSFSRYEAKHKTANWLYSVRPDRLETALPGGQIFRFTWNLAQARRWQRYQRGRGMDTYLYSAEAHGGPCCPITPSMLAATRARQGYVILHEAWHSTLRLRNIRVPYPLEEATGRVVGVLGAIHFARRMRDKDLLVEALAQKEAWGDLARFVNRTSGKLERSYAQRSHRQASRHILSQARTAADRLSARTTSEWEQEEFRREMNNAFFFRYRDYTQYYPLALQVCERLGSLKRAMVRYASAGRRGAIEHLQQIVR